MVGKRLRTRSKASGSFRSIMADAECIRDLDKHNLVKFANSDWVFG